MPVVVELKSLKSKKVDWNTIKYKLKHISML
jgi:hypothetical protein